MTVSTGDWEVVGRPHTTNGGKNAHVRVQRVDKPGVTETRLWGVLREGHGDTASDHGGGQAMMEVSLVR